MTGAHSFGGLVWSNGQDERLDVSLIGPQLLPSYSFLALKALQSTVPSPAM